MLQYEANLCRLHILLSSNECEVDRILERITIKIAKNTIIMKSFFSNFVTFVLPTKTTNLQTPIVSDIYYSAVTGDVIRSNQMMCRNKTVNTERTSQWTDDINAVTGSIAVQLH